MLKQNLPHWNIQDFEPQISRETMNVHVNQLHKGYVDKLNKRFGGTQLLATPPSLVLQRLDGFLDTKDQTFYRNMMGGNVTHTLFWKVISPTAPTTYRDGLFVRKLMESSSFRNGNTHPLIALKKKIIESGLKRFGSGWVWGVLDPQKNFEFKLYSTRNHDTPYMRGHVPVFCVDVWEHAYFIDRHGNRKMWLEVICEFLDFDIIDQICQAQALEGFDPVDLWVLNKL